MGFAQLVNVKDLFPTKGGPIIFISYMGFFICQGIVITASKESDNTYAYNTVTVVLLTECVKLLVSFALYLKENSLRSFFTDVTKDSKVLLLYFVPSFLYCIYNNLSFINLQAFDPTSYFLLLQFRVVVTGIIYQFVFSKKLTKRQWGCLILLTMGCIVQHLGKSSSLGFSSFMTFNILLMLLQVFCSCFAGVYNEYLLKDVGSKVNIYIQNVYMYIDSIICNLGLLLVTGQGFSAFSSTSLQNIFQTLVLCIIAINSACGIVTSFFLKDLNSILKTFASALEILFTAVLCYFIFGDPVTINTILAIFIVCLSTYLYSQAPVVNTKPNALKEEKESDRQSLLEEGLLEMEN